MIVLSQCKEQSNNHQRGRRINSGDDNLNKRAKPPLSHRQGVGVSTLVWLNPNPTQYLCLVGVTLTREQRHTLVKHHTPHNKRKTPK